jgi:hypothetical protein
MTHDELLTLIGDPMPDCSCRDCGYINALRSVATLHRWEDKHRGMRIKQHCPECGFSYPCPTIEAIIKEIK